MILLLDNFDSFVHNLARYFRNSGCATTVVRTVEVTAEVCLAMRPDAIVISPGPKRPEDAGCSVDVIRRLAARPLESAIPLLGVCLGHQAIAVAMGGHITTCDPLHGLASVITHEGVGIFRGCPSPMRVGRYHSLAIEEATLPDRLLVTARSEDGQIMAVQDRILPLVGVQFHPESVLSEQGQQMIDNFVAMCATRGYTAP